jgi:hypothetical protein
MKRSKDPYEKRFFGVASRGNPRPYTRREYNAWYCMVRRCYYPKDKSYKSYGAKGVRVCDRWLCLEYFLEDIQKLPNYKKFITTGEYNLDKDMKQINKLSSEIVYSPEVCQFIPRIQNSKMNSLHKEELENKSSIYYGVTKTRTGNFTSCIYKDSTRYFLGTYDDEIAAATVYNYVEKQCAYYPKLNLGIPKMDINDAFSHLVGIKCPTFPPNFNATCLDINIQKQNPYFGVSILGEDRYRAIYAINGKAINIGVFDSVEAAANAHNYYVNHYNPNGLINKVAYMTPATWLSHKTTSKNNVQMCSMVKRQMCTIID